MSLANWKEGNIHFFPTTGRARIFGNFSFKVWKLNTQFNYFIQNYTPTVLQSLWLATKVVKNLLSSAQGYGFAWFFYVYCTLYQNNQYFLLFMRFKTSKCFSSLPIIYARGNIIIYVKALSNIFLPTSNARKYHVSLIQILFLHRVADTQAKFWKYLYLYNLIM